MEATPSLMQPKDLSNLYARRIAVNIGAVVRELGISQSHLISELEQRGATVNPGNLSKYLAGKAVGPLGLFMELALILNISLDRLAAPDFDAAAEARRRNTPAKTESGKSTSLRVDIHGDAFITDPEAPEFQGYLRMYHVYMLSPASSDRKLLCGTLRLENGGDFCRVTLSFDAKQPNDDRCILYTGQAVISRTLSMVYMLLTNVETGELNAISFRHFHFRHHPLEQLRQLHCRLAAMLTNGAGEYNSPTMCRMLLSREEIAPEHLSLLAPHLHLNSGDITVHNPSLVRLSMASDQYKELIHQLTQFGAVNTYCWSEEFVMGFGKMSLPEEELSEFLARIRDVSAKIRLNKASRRADHAVRDLLLSLGYFQSES